jgi:hypothetical protein
MVVGIGTQAVREDDLPAPIDNVVSLDKPSVRDVVHASVRG